MGTSEAIKRTGRSTKERSVVAWRLVGGYLRSWWDFTVFVLRYRKGFARVAFWAVVALVSFRFPTDDDPLWRHVLGIAATAAAVVDLFLQCWDVRSHQVPLRKVPYDEYPVPPGHERVIQERRDAPDDYAFVACCELLASSGLTRGDAPGSSGRWLPDAYEMRSEMRSVAAAVLSSHYRRNKAPHFNGRIVRQRSDVDGSDTITLGFADYFELLSTNYLAERMVRNRKDECLVIGSKWMERRSGDQLFVRTIADSVLADGIGVSSLALTADQPRRLLVVKQSYRSSSSPGLWAPSSSGSMDERDLRGKTDGVAFPFVETVIHGMRRELGEESNVDVDPDDVADTRLLGYFRWLNKGAKPEYVGVTKLKLQASQLRVEPRPLERPWVLRLSATPELDMDALMGEKIEMALPEKVEGLLETDQDQLRGAVSFPLYMALWHLRRALRDDAEFRTWFEQP